MNEEQYKKVYDYAEKVEEFADKISDTVGGVIDQVVEIVNGITDALHKGAEEARTMADKEAMKNTWGATTDPVSPDLEAVRRQIKESLERFLRDINKDKDK